MIPTQSHSFFSVTSCVILDCQIIVWQCNNKKKKSLFPLTACISSVQLPHSLTCARRDLRACSWNENENWRPKHACINTQKPDKAEAEPPVCAFSSWCSNAAWSLCGLFLHFFSFLINRIPCWVDQEWVGQVERLVGLCCQHAPAVSEHPEAVGHCDKVSLNLYSECCL